MAANQAPPSLGFSRQEYWSGLPHWKRPWCWERLKTGGEGVNRGWDCWMASPTWGHEFEQAPGVGDGKGSLACCNAWCCKKSDMTEWLNWTDWMLILDGLLTPQARMLQKCSVFQISSSSATVFSDTISFTAWESLVKISIFSLLSSTHPCLHTIIYYVLLMSPS